MAMLTDYSFATFEDIVSDIRTLVVHLPKINKKLLKLRGEVATKSSRLDNPESILKYIDYCVFLFEGYENDLKRLLAEIPIKLRKQHIVILHELIERSKHEEIESCVGFKREHIVTELKDISLRYLVDGIYKVTRDLMSFVGGLDGMQYRLKTFIGSIPPDKIRIPSTPSIIRRKKTQENIIKNIVPFPAPAGSSWVDVKICFLSNVAVEIRVGAKREGREYTTLGFMDERNGNPSILWLALASFGKCGGEISRESTGLNNRITEKLKAHVHRLRNILTQIFGIYHESPFKYKKFPLPGKYTTRFHIELNTKEIYDEIADDFAPLKFKNI